MTNEVHEVMVVGTLSQRPKEKVDKLINMKKTQVEKVSIEEEVLIVVREEGTMDKAEVLTFPL